MYLPYAERLAKRPVGILSLPLLPSLLSRGEVQSTSTLNDWARYVDRMNRQNLT